MYTFREIRPRIERIRVKVRDSLLVADAEVETHLLEGSQKYFNYPPLLQKPSISESLPQ